ncbi:MAG: CBS domain-containing protein [Candidatus Wukongarchaeota archaeon]|nr:CBS domain-containing protein [Candidatus Wukongarchaeota archaeon]
MAEGVTMVTVKEIMTQDPLAVEVPGTREEVLEKIRDTGFFAFPCVKKGTKELVGIITKEDLIQKPKENQIAMLMKRDFITVTSNDKIKDAVKIMLKERVRRLPVITLKDEKEGIKEVVGIITIADVIKKIIARLDTEKTVQKYYDRNIVVVWEDTPLRIVWKIMNLAGQQALTTLDDKGKLSGIITVDDLVGVAEVVGSQKTSQTGSAAEYTTSSWDSVEVLIIFSQELRFPEIPVSEVSVKKVQTAFEGTTIVEGARKMGRYDIDQLPVLDAKGELVGMVTDFDLCKVFLDSGD